MAKFCGNCGSKMDSDASFCVNCGTANSGVVKPNYSSDTAWTNGFAIAGFICSFVFALVGLILSIVGVQKADEHNGELKGLAIAGIIIAAINMALGLIISIANISAL
jgi:uncharacterized protein YacL